MCCLLRTPEMEQGRDMVNLLQASFHRFTGHQSSTKHCAAFHNEYNVALALKKTRIYSRRETSRVPSRVKYGLRLRYKPESRVRVDPHSSI